ncbi:hypothetical protein HPP92_013154 [Vanilla planifolia]|uniref:Neurobeachin alpha-solenoid region domain-containing protein n=1 Tax=Vanilla planifolia TaxID=51239 RepID=A0A835QXL5_VANPL|nr:hypothetical protein HPP92_013154 [Vanilla planifolia]
MNIVKGVADLLRRSSGGQGADCGSWPNADKHSSPSLKIQFSETGDEAILATLWQRYENTIDKVEKRKSLQVFFLHFIQTYRDWEPKNDNQLSIEVASLDDTVVGCSSGHPSEVMLIIVQEIARLTSLVSELNSSTAKYGADVAELSASLTYNTDGLYALNSLMIANRSWHNCKVFSYYGGVQKVAALLKAVVQLKALASAPSVDESSSCNAEKIRFLQTILGYVVSIVSGFMELYSSGNKTVEHVDVIKSTFVKYTQPEISSLSLKDSISQPRKLWQERAIVMVMEAGGLNWLVGKGKSHFKSIGGLEVLLDEIGPPSSNFSATRSTIISGDDRRICVYGIFHLQVLSLETLRESVFGNLNNLQFLCENGRIHKFANGICWPAFILQDWRVKFGLAAVDFQDFNPNSVKENPEMIPQDVITLLNMSDSSNLLEWKRYSVRLSRGLCSFLLAPEDIKSHHGEASSKNSMPISLGFWELCIRWIMKILLTIFQCIKACSNERELPSHIRVLDNTMQHCILSTFRRVLLFAPALLEVFREEGIWSMIFSEKFFCVGPFLEELDMEFEAKSKVKVSDVFAVSDIFEDKLKNSDVDILQVEAVSFLEFAATLTANTNNLPECSVLIDALEQSAHNPELATIFLRSLQRILQLTPDRCLGSFKSLDAITRALKVACIQAREVRKHVSNGPDEGGSTEIFGEKKIQAVNCPKNVTSWVNCMKSSIELFNEYISISEHVRSLVLHNASCIDCLFDLFWEKSVRKDVLEQILGLIKLPTMLPDDRTAKLHLCSKYLEIFTHAKEWEEFYPELSIDLLVSMREIISIDHEYYQTLFRDGECFLHIVSLLNGTYEEEMAEQLVLNVLHTLTLLLTGSNNSKAAFRALVGVGYQTLQSLLLDFCKWHPREGLLNALLDMLVDGKFDKKANSVIKNDDVIPLFFNVLQKCSTSLQHYGLDVFQNLLKDSISNRTSCSKAGLLTVLLDWFAIVEDEKLITKLAQLIQVIGGHSISGKDIRKIFALLRCESIGSKNNNSSLLLASLQYMLMEKGPEAFLNSVDIGLGS